MNTCDEEEKGVKSGKQTRFCRIITVVTPTLKENLDAAAERLTTNRSLLIRQACEKHLRDLEAEEKGA